jgi:hypothetical protein
VPKFKEMVKLVDKPSDPGVTDPELEPDRDPEVPQGPEGGSGMFTTKRKIAVAAAGGGVGLILLGGVFGTQAKGQGRSKAMLANVSYGVGALALAGAAFLWFTGAPETSDGASVSVSPRLGDSTGLDVLVRF